MNIKHKKRISKISFILAAILFVVSMLISLPSKNYSLTAATGKWDDPSLLANTYGVNELKSYVSNGKYWVDIATPAQLGYLCYMINIGNATYRNYNVKIVANLNMSKHYWTPISVFDETFDGNGYTISSLYIKSTSNNIGFIAYTSYNSNEIKNLTLNTPKICSFGLNTAYLVGYADGSIITNCRINSGSISLDSTPSLAELRIGSVVGFGYASSISKTSSSSTIRIIAGTSYTNVYAGGIIGYSNNTNVNLSSNFGIINITKGVNVYAGGIVGYLTTANNNTSYNIIQKCGNTGNVTVGTSTNPSATYVSVGGIVGEITNTGSNTPKVLYCFNRAYISGYSQKRTNLNRQIIDTSGIHPYTNNATRVSGHYEVVGGGFTSDTCYNLSLEYNTGIYPTPLYCYINGHYKDNQESYYYEEGYYLNKGGIVGKVSSSATKTQIISCYNTGTINSTNAYMSNVYNIKLKLWYISYSVRLNFYNIAEVTVDNNTCDYLIEQISKYTYYTYGNIVGSYYAVTLLNNCYDNERSTASTFSFEQNYYNKGNSWSGPEDMDTSAWENKTAKTYIESIVTKINYSLSQGVRTVTYSYDSLIFYGFVGNNYFHTYLTTSYYSVNFPVNMYPDYGSTGVTLANLGDPYYTVNGNVIKIWAIDSTGKINAGYPYHAENYWIQDTQEPSKA